MINKIQEKPYFSPYSSLRNTTTNITEYNQEKSDEDYNVSFGANPDTSNFTKRFRLIIRRLFNYMSSPSELTNTAIAAIGTGVIAPAVILVSPGKGDKKDKEKKKFQALRQPLSAILAFGFQLPTTLLSSAIINKLAYKNKVKIFADENLGDLVPTKKYLKNHVPEEEYNKLLKEFDELGPNGEKSKLRKELEQLIIDGHREVGLETSEEELAKRVNKRKENFLNGKYAEAERDKIFGQKVKEMLNKNIQINELDLVSESEQNLAIHRNKDAYDAIEKEANLSSFDKIIRKLKMSNKNIDALEDKQEAFAKEKGLEILKADHKELFATQEAKLKKYVKVLEENSKDLFEHRKMLITLFFNLFMTVLSCMALNWIHPRFKEWLDNRHQKPDNDKQNAAPQDEQKVEVRA